MTEDGPRMLSEAEALEVLDMFAPQGLVELSLPVVVGLALRETVRTPAEQDALLALARLVANPMWPADQEATRTWKHSPCEGCGWRIPPGETRCLSVLCKTEAP